MTADEFYQKFELFAECPGAVAKMRELILTLAMRGELVKPDPGDVPASELLKQVEEEKKRESHGGAGARSKTKKLPTITFDEIPYAIPEGWEWVRLGSFLEMINGRAFKPHDWISYGLPIVRIQNLNNPNKPFNYCDEETVKQQHIIKNGSFLISWSGTPGTSFGAFIWKGGKAALNQHIFSCFQVGDPFADTFLMRAINARLDFLISKAQGGVGLRHVTKGTLEKMLLPLPPFAEQKRIVEKVDELMGLCDELETRQAERERQQNELHRAALYRFQHAPTSDNLNLLFQKTWPVTPADLRNTILTLAVQGKLVPQKTDEESKERLIDILRKHRAELLASGSIRKSKPCRDFGLEEVPYNVPDSWDWAMLGEITDIGTGSTPSRAEPKFWNGSIPWVSSGSTSRSTITEGDELITEDAVRAHRLRVYPPGTLLVALYGQGKTRGQVSMLRIFSTINQACAAICPLEGITSMNTYLELLLQKQYDEMRLQSAGGAQPNLNVQKIKELLVPLPPLEEQKRIVDKVYELMVLVDKLEDMLTQSQDEGTLLLEAFLSEITR